MRIGWSYRRWRVLLVAVMAAAALLAASGCSADNQETRADTATERGLDTSGTAPSTAPVEVFELTEPIGDGWYLDYQAPWGFTLTREPTAETFRLGATNLSVGFLSEVNLPSDPLAGLAGADTVTLAPFTEELDYADWLSAIPGVTVGERAGVQVDGIEGISFDMTVGALPEQSDCGGFRCVGLWEAHGDIGVAIEGEPDREMLLGSGLDQIAVAYGPTGTDFDDLAESVVASSEFT